MRFRHRVPALVVGLVAAALPVTVTSAGAVTPTWRFAFVRGSGESAQAFVAEPGAAPRRLSSDIAPTMVRLSPAGDQLALLRRYAYRFRDGDVAVSDLAGSCTRHVVDDNAGATGVAWTPDGHDLSFANRYVSGSDNKGAGLFSVPVTDLARAAKRLVAAPVADDAPSWSPDGRRVAYGVIGTDGTSDLVVTDIPGGVTTALADATVDVANPAYSPDGHWLAYIRRTVPAELIVANADGTSPSVLPTNLPSVAEPVWTPDSGTFLVAGGDGIFAVPRQGGSADRLTSGEDSSPTVAPAGVAAPSPGAGYELVGDRLRTRAFGAGCPVMFPDAFGQPYVGVAQPTAGGGAVAATAIGLSSSVMRHSGFEGPVGPAAPIVSVAATPDGGGWWLAGADGGVFTFGDAPFMGSAARLRLNRPIGAVSATASGQGYWLVGADGGVFTFGDATYLGSLSDLALNAPIVAAEPTPSGRGLWLVGRDGGVFTLGDAAFFGSLGGTRLAGDVVDIAATRSGRGYWLVGRDGGVFAFGDAPFLGSAAGTDETYIGMIDAGG